MTLETSTDRANKTLAILRQLEQSTDATTDRYHKSLTLAMARLQATKKALAKRIEKMDAGMEKTSTEDAYINICDTLYAYQNGRGVCETLRLKEHNGDSDSSTQRGASGCALR
jgi:hypothetical protein